MKEYFVLCQDYRELRYVFLYTKDTLGNLVCRISKGGGLPEITTTDGRRLRFTTCEAYETKHAFGNRHIRTISGALLEQKLDALNVKGEVIWTRNT
jgi:hypothetical protein